SLPWTDEEKQKLFESGGQPTRLHDNCSGKHAGFLTVARHLGHPVEGYNRLDHPVQQHVLGIVEQMTENLRFDPLRLVEAVIAGVAFIGAGAIFGKRGSINGITTAASLLMVSVIGIAAGFNYYVLASAATALTLLVLVALKLIDRSLGRRRPEGEHPPE
ncbi:MAG: asparaginase, partial [Lysobacter spongiicola]|nr:asparaginase [Lysobacter spongiicola]